MSQNYFKSEPKLKCRQSDFQLWGKGRGVGGPEVTENRGYTSTS